MLQQRQGRNKIFKANKAHAQSGVVQVVYEGLALQQIAKAGQVDDNDMAPGCRARVGRARMPLLAMDAGCCCIHEHSQPSGQVGLGCVVQKIEGQGALLTEAVLHCGLHLAGR